MWMEDTRPLASVKKRGTLRSRQVLLDVDVSGNNIFRNQKAIRGSGGSDMDQDTYSIGQMCSDFDVTARTLRYYEGEELLSPIRDGQRRIYTNKCRARLSLILRGKRFGFSLKEIRELLELYHLGDGQVTQLSATLEAAENHHRGLLAQRAELEEAIAELEEHMDLVRSMLADKGSAQAAE